MSPTELRSILDAHAKWRASGGSEGSRANLGGADLSGADLSGAILPDGRIWEDYRADHLAGLCSTPEVRERAVAAWGNHEWSNCPMHAALGVSCATTREIATWVALYDAGLLKKPELGQVQP